VVRVGMPRLVPGYMFRGNLARNMYPEETGLERVRLAALTTPRCCAPVIR